MDTPAPLWSVMIPTYNCAATLRQTLQSVLDQDPGPAIMQIEVADNCSTKDRPEDIVAELGKGRVRFHRNPENLGPSRNFNMCIERSQGELVHILHGDDYVLPGFYARLGELAARHPEAALYGTRVNFINQQCEITGISHALPRLAIVSLDCTDFFYATPLCYAGVAIRRSFYQKHGGFDTTFIFCPDCDMWARAVAVGGGIVLDEPLAHYRFLGQDHTAMVRTANHFREMDRLAGIFAGRHPEFSWSRHHRRVAREAWYQAQRYRQAGVMDGYAANIEFYQKHGSPWLKTRLTLKGLFKQLIGKKL